MTTATPEAGITLGTPLRDEAVRDIHFFNGRLLTGGDLQREQAARQLADRRVGAAVGPGVAWGLEVQVEVQALPGTPAGRVRVRRGLGVSPSGGVLYLATDPTVRLVAPAAEALASVATGFGPCGALAGVVDAAGVAGSGLFLLTLAPLAVAEGKAPVLALEAVNTRCATDAFVEALQFRLLRVNGIDLGGTDEIAIENWRSRAARAFLAPPSLRPPGAVAATQAVSGLSDCDLPLALVGLRDGAVLFVDRWAVRRRIASPAAAEPWGGAFGEQALSLAEARVQQFQEQLQAPGSTSANAALLGAAASARLAWLPPVGWLPADTDWRRFLGPLAPQHAQPVPLAAADAPSLVATALRDDPVALPSAPGAAGYRIWQVGGASGPLLFARDSRNTMHAERVWLDGARAGMPGVADVQEAIDSLRAGQCPKLVLRPSMRPSELAAALARASGEDLDICFEPGRYRLDRPLMVGKRQRVRISGHGAELVNEKSACALFITQCEAVCVSDIAVGGVASGGAFSNLGDASEGALTIIDTADVAVHGVRARMGKGSSANVAAITVALLADRLQDDEGTRAVIERCTLEAGLRQRGLVLHGFGHSVVAGNHLQSPPGQGALSGFRIRGATGGSVRLHDNVVRGVASGLEVSLGRKPGLGDGRRGILDVQRNHVLIDPRAPGTGKPTGIELLGAQKVTVSGNRIGSDDPEVWFAGLIGVLLQGSFGPQLLVRDNLFDGCRIGVRFEPDKPPVYYAWVFQCNVAIGPSGENPDVLNLPPNVSDIVDEHNLPPDGRRPK